MLHVSDAVGDGKTSTVPFVRHQFGRFLCLGCNRWTSAHPALPLSFNRLLGENYRGMIGAFFTDYTQIDCTVEQERAPAGFTCVHVNTAAMM